jgi:hypothetical protein
VIRGSASRAVTTSTTTAVAATTFPTGFNFGFLVRGQGSEINPAHGIDFGNPNVEGVTKINHVRGVLDEIGR